MLKRTHLGWLLFSLCCCFACKNGASETGVHAINNSADEPVLPTKPAATLGEIAVDEGWKRVSHNSIDQGNWFRSLRLLPDHSVHLYNGAKKRNQEAQYAVLDVPIGDKDLMQCADVAIWLHAASLRDSGRLHQINFLSTSGEWIAYKDWLNGTRWRVGQHLLPYQTVAGEDNQQNFSNYLEFVYTYCGTYSLSRQLKPVEDWSDVKVGDIFIEGGFPGHCVTVVDMEQNKEGKQRMMLVQGYMPAQQLQVLKNSNLDHESVWYDIPKKGSLSTPEWNFGEKAILGRW